MNAAENSEHRGRVVGLQERRLGSTIVRTYRAKIPLDEVMPNERQPRLGPKEDEELQRQIEANQGVFEPLLVEPHPDYPDKFRIIDGERRRSVTSTGISWYCSRPRAASTFEFVPRHLERRRALHRFDGGVQVT